MSTNRLVIVPSIGAWQNHDGKIFTPNKFLTGVEEYAMSWLGDVVVLIRLDEKANNNLDNVPINVDALSFDVRVFSNAGDPQVIETLQEASVVLLNPTFSNTGIARICQVLSIPYVCITEYSLKTQLQIITSLRVSSIKKIRKYIWILRQELRLRRILALASGIQCNGFPTYEAYKKLNDEIIYYLDNRIRHSHLISQKQLSKRLNELQLGRPIRLVFSGRLIAMKGADHLILVAKELKKLQVKFSMHIFGAGELENEMKAAIIKHELAANVIMGGVLNFESELIPRISKECDLFVCCHRQGDPSCTYIETLCCGVPIVGYSNEAFSGIMKYSDIGYEVPINNFKALAKIIACIDSDRGRLISLSYNSVDFAKKHLFEDNFTRRIAQLTRLAKVN